MNNSSAEPASGSTGGYNIVPFASMAGGWLGPLLMFWLYVWGPLRPFAYPAGDLMPDAAFGLLILGCILLWWLPPAYFKLRSFERNGRLYRILGVHHFRKLVPDGDLANRWARRHDRAYRVIRGPASAAAYLRRTEQSERGHVVLGMLGVVSAAYALQLGWYGWAGYLSIGNAAVNLYPIMLQRYTRSRFRRLAARDGRSTQRG